MPNHYVGDSLHTIAISGLSRVRTELLRLAVVMPLPPHPVQMPRQLPGHCYLGDLASTPHGQMEERVAPLGLAPYCDLLRFHQQEAQQHVALLTDVSQSTPIATGLFRRNQTYIAGNLLPAVKAFGSSNHQLVRQRRQRTNSGMRHQSPRHRTGADYESDRPTFIGKAQSWQVSQPDKAIRLLVVVPCKTSSGIHPTLILKSFIWLRPTCPIPSAGLTCHGSTNIRESCMR